MFPLSTLAVKEKIFDAASVIPKRLPDFFVLGASRSGTTFLHHALRSHPDIFMPLSKELHYFNKNQKYRSDLAGYRTLFRGYKGETLIGEITPFYFYYGMLYQEDGNVYLSSEESSVQRIYSHCPEAKILITLRDPFVRLLSMYKKNFSQGKYNKTLQEALENELDSTDPNSFPNLLYRSRYDIHLDGIFRYYPKQNCKILIFEEWVEDIDKTFEGICQFLDVEYYQLRPEDPARALNDEKKYTARSEKNLSLDLDPLVKQRALEYLEPSYQYVQNLLGRSVPWTETSQEGAQNP